MTNRCFSPVETMRGWGTYLFHWEILKDVINRTRTVAFWFFLFWAIFCQVTSKTYGFFLHGRSLFSPWPTWSPVQFPCGNAVSATVSVCLEACCSSRPCTQRSANNHYIVGLCFVWSWQLPAYNCIARIAFGKFDATRAKHFFGQAASDCGAFFLYFSVALTMCSVQTWYIIALGLRILVVGAIFFQCGSNDSIRNAGEYNEQVCYRVCFLTVFFEYANITVSVKFGWEAVKTHPQYSQIMHNSNSSKGISMKIKSGYELIK